MPPAGIDPNDIFYNGAYYNRNGNGGPVTYNLDANGNPTGLKSPSGAVLPLGGTACEGFGAVPLPVGAAPAAAALQVLASANVAAINAAIAIGGRVTLTKPGIYVINATFLLPDFTTVVLGRGVILVRIAGGGACTFFQNANPTTGNQSIAVVGEGIMYCNANGYVATLAANPADCPNIPALSTANIPGIIESGGSVTINQPYVNGLHFDNVNGLVVGGGLKVMQAVKYQLYGCALKNWYFEGIDFYSDDTVNPANGGTYGRDSIHVQGNTTNGTIRNMTGTVNDDFMVLNVRDVASWVTPRSTGPITNILIENIFGKNQRRGGATVHLYAGLDVGTVNAPNTNGYDTAPTLVSITQVAGIATATTSAAHNMAVGSAFYITGSNIAGYNTGTAAYGQALPLGRVLSVPSSTTFTYSVPSGTATPATASLGTFVRYYQMSGITLRNIRGNVYSDACINLAVTTDSPQNFGVIDNLVVDGVSLLLNNVLSAGHITSSFVRVQDATISNVTTTANYQAPALDFSANNSYAAGTLTLNNFKGMTPYKPYSASGQGYIQLGNRDNVVINSLSVTIQDGGGGWNQAVSPGTTTGGTLTFNSPTVRALTSASLYNLQSSGNFGTMIVNAPNFDAGTGLGSLGGSITGGQLIVNNGNFQTFNNAQINVYGTNISIALNNNKYISGASGLIYASNATGVLSIRSQGNDFGSVPLFNPGSSFGTTSGGVSLFGDDLKADISSTSKVIARTAASKCIASVNAGTILAGNLVVCDATAAANSWKQVSNSALAY